MMDGLPGVMRDEKTPPEVQVTDEPREPVRDPSLGIEVEVAAEETPRHRLVAIGDSLTHGFQSGAIYNTDLSSVACSRSMGSTQPPSATASSLRRLST